jgi:enamine deaminase RidA (YjgF/YER057c/UK114 family)
LLTKKATVASAGTEDGPARCNKMWKKQEPAPKNILQVPKPILAPEKQTATNIIVPEKIHNKNANVLLVCNESSDDLGCSVVEWDGLRQTFATVVPTCGNTFAEQAQATLQSLQSILRKEGAADSIVMQTVFLADGENQNVCRRMMREFYGKNLPATTYISQMPCPKNHLAIEAWSIAGINDPVQIERFGSKMVLARHGGKTWAFLADIRPGTAAQPLYDRSLSAFHSASFRLQGAGMRFDDVVRTWLYLGNITGAEKETTRYLELNRARTDYFRNKKFLESLVPPAWNKPVYPASTGIGAQSSDIVLGCIALKSEQPDTVLIPLENPQQIAAYDYAHEYGPESPKFARAMAIASGESVATFISGTASITASDTRHVDDLERQTHQTLDNIEVLISPDNFQKHGFPGMGATLGDLALARIYLKRPEDYQEARAICRQRLGDLPAVFVVGDICRPELLVEIEALAFSPRHIRS